MNTEVFLIYIYVLFTFLIFPIQFILVLFSKRAKEFLQKRKTDKEQILSIPEKFTQQRVIWLHAASVGELDQCKALIHVIKQNEPDTVIIQSVFSDSVTKAQLENSNANISFRLPLDFYFSYDFIFQKFQPEIVILMAWDTWPNLVLSAKRHKAKIFLFCASLSKSSGRNSFFMKNLTKSVFKKLDAISVADESFKEEFTRITENEIPVFALGDTRVDSVIGKIETRDKKKDPLKKLSPIKEKIVIFASTYSVCEKILIPEIHKILSKSRSVWIFPHQVTEKRISEIQNILSHEKISFSIFSEIQTSHERVILFDRLGILAFAYELAELAYVGGAIHNRVHNVLEPAYFGLPIVCGKNISHSPEAISLKKEEGLFSLSNENQIPEVILELLTQNEKLKKIRKQNKEFVQSQKGASIKIYNQFIRPIR